MTAVVDRNFWLTRKACRNGIVALWENQDQLDLLKSDIPKHIDNAIDEIVGSFICATPIIVNTYMFCSNHARFDSIFVLFGIFYVSSSVSNRPTNWATVKPTRW